MAFFSLFLFPPPPLLLYLLKAQNPQENGQIGLGKGGIVKTVGADQPGSSFSSCRLAVRCPGMQAWQRHNPVHPNHRRLRNARWGRETEAEWEPVGWLLLQKQELTIGTEFKKNNATSQATGKPRCQTHALLQSQTVGSGWPDLQPVTELNELPGHLFPHKNNNKKTPRAL